MLQWNSQNAAGLLFRILAVNARIKSQVIKRLTLDAGIVLFMKRICLIQTVHASLCVYYHTAVSIKTRGQERPPKRLTGIFFNLTSLIP
jgi:hypothetical protein